MNRQAVVAIVVLLVVAGAGILVYTRIFESDVPPQHEIVVCKHCQNVFEVRLRGSRGGAPYVCPECHETAAYLAYQCTDPECGAIFPVETGAMPEGEESVCPVCDSEGRRLYSIPPDAKERARRIREVLP